jgi:hypothetical protein
MSIFTTLAISGMGLGRIALGVAPFLAAGSSARMLGFPASHDNATSRLMGRLFGVRDIGLGVLAFYAVRHPETLGFIMLFQAAMDLGDLFAISIPLIRRQGIDRAALASALFATIGGLGWLIMWLIAG